MGVYILDGMLFVDDVVVGSSVPATTKSRLLIV